VPQDRPITGRHLFRHEAEPGGKVASFGKGSAVGNGRHHRTCDERTDAWNRHQLPATLAPLCQLLDLLGNALDALIEPPPIATEVLDDSDHTRRQYVDALSQKLREPLAQKARSLADCNAAL
jgi:hypothetical protein